MSYDWIVPVSEYGGGRAQWAGCYPGRGGAVRQGEPHFREIISRAEALPSFLKHCWQKKFQPNTEKIRYLFKFVIQSALFYLLKIILKAQLQTLDKTPIYLSTYRCRYWCIPVRYRYRYPPVLKLNNLKLKLILIQRLLYQVLNLDPTSTLIRICRSHIRGRTFFLGSRPWICLWIDLIKLAQPTCSNLQA